MKRLSLLLVIGAAIVPTTARSQLIMQMSNGWAFSFSGNVNAFWVYTSQTNSGPSNSSIRTGLLPAFANFDAKGKEAGLNLGVHFGFAPQINTGGVHDNFIGTSIQAGAQIDMREVFLTVGGAWGQILAGRELGLFSRQNILNDMTLFGTGAVGIGGTQARGTTLGRIGYGYLYPNFVSQVTYSNKTGTPLQFAVGLFEPSTLGSTGFTQTSLPRLEGEVTYTQKSGANKFLVWVGGLLQNTKTAVTVPTSHSVTSVAGTAGVKADRGGISIVANAYIGSGVGNVLLFSGQEVAPSGTDLRKSDGGYLQVTYTPSKAKTTFGLSYGFSRIKNAGAGETVATGGNGAVRTQWTSYTAGLYHQWTKSLKLVLEATREQQGIGGAAPAQFDIAPGVMLFF